MCICTVSIIIKYVYNSPAKHFVLVKQIMDDIRNDVFFRFRDVTKQNGRASVGTLYREPLGEMVVHYDNISKIEKKAKVRYIQYN